MESLRLSLARCMGEAASASAVADETPVLPEGVEEIEHEYTLALSLIVNAAVGILGHASALGMTVG